PIESRRACPGAASHAKKSRMIFRKFTFFAAAIALAAPARAAGDPIVTIESGKLKGAVEAGGSLVQIFRGIPFAAPPVADLRWREPQPVIPWSGIREATEFGPRCMQQPLFSDMMFRSPAPREDCLYLNVWTPARLDGSRQ